MSKKIYFAGSIRGGRVDAALYQQIIDHIKETDIVLTEHIGRPDLNVIEHAKRDAEIYEQDMGWLRECDLVIAECTCPSLGVGYELAYAEKCGKPCHIFYNRTKTQLSAPPERASSPMAPLPAKRSSTSASGSHCISMLKTASLTFSVVGLMPLGTSIFLYLYFPDVIFIFL